jgi:hypothetical protein
MDWKHKSSKKIVHFAFKNRSESYVFRLIIDYVTEIIDHRIIEIINYNNQLYNQNIFDI